ncbi:hypothetical protein EYZ11_011671 [Aspergillus tanneri]|uniref:Ferric reductase NAD binding domain-containing protein n=1 Tax=Aspergillus tanneri TaxID=1220188 RepID=A0A4S3J4B9_9EURO|nr:hypothetical protein EYZ11_011671 [Aspergillus tanneri]
MTFCKKSTVPRIMVAARTNIALVLGFLYERVRLKTLVREVGSSLLFFGCRTGSQYLYQDELDEIVSWVIHSGFPGRT